MTLARRQRLTGTLARLHRGAGGSEFLLGLHTVFFFFFFFFFVLSSSPRPASRRFIHFQVPKRFHGSTVVGQARSNKISHIFLPSQLSYKLDENQMFAAPDV